MNEVTPTVEKLCALPRSEWRHALQTLVVDEFESTLPMLADEELPVDKSFFDLGFTSLRITEVKLRLETLLGRPISANVLFNYPTIDALVTYLMAEVLAGVFGESESSHTDAHPTRPNTLWDRVTEVAYDL
ncbi:MAG: acyl carrier protein [Pseudonocardiales bacterium]|nr:acyl carrier protein [Pseudonocardiales bacterium]